MTGTHLGIGAIVSFQIKFIHPHTNRNVKFPNPVAGQRLTGCRVVRRALKKINHKPTICAVVHHDDFKDEENGDYYEIWCNESHVRVDKEGESNMFFLPKLIDYDDEGYHTEKEREIVEATTFVSDTVATNTSPPSTNAKNEEEYHVDVVATASVSNIDTSTALEHKKLLTTLFVHPIMTFFGLYAVKEAFGHDVHRCATRLFHKSLFLLGFANFIDTILDLVTSSLVILKINKCDNSSNEVEAYILFTMTLVAGCVRSVSGKIQLKHVDGGAEAIKYRSWARMFKIVLFESIVFVIEDGASILFLASRKCKDPLDIISLSFTIISLISVCFHSICLSCLGFGRFVCRLKTISPATMSEVYIAFPTFIYSTLFNVFYVYQIFIAITKIIMPYSEGNKNEDLGVLKLPTYIVYWVGVVVLSFFVIIIILDHFELIPSELEQDQKDLLERQRLAKQAILEEKEKDKERIKKRRTI